jgi:hypothetical protein
MLSSVAARFCSHANGVAAAFLPLLLSHTCFLDSICEPWSGYAAHHKRLWEKEAGESLGC